MRKDWRPKPVGLFPALYGSGFVSWAIGFAVATFQGLWGNIVLLAVVALITFALAQEERLRLYTLLPHAAKLAYGVALMSALCVIDLMSREDAATNHTYLRAAITALGSIGVFHRVRASAAQAVADGSGQQQAFRLPGVSFEKTDAKRSEAERLVNAYGDVLGRFSGVIVADETELPASKNAIGSALKLAYLAGPSAVLKKGFIELAGFQPNVGAEPVVAPAKVDPELPEGDPSTAAAIRAVIDAGEGWLRWMEVVNEESAQRLAETATWDHPSDD